MSHENTILLELFAIFIWAKIFGEIFEYLKLPSVLGEISAGAILGPHLFSLVTPNEFTLSIAELGAVFLLLSVGLETDPQDLVRVGGTSVKVAVGGVVLPFALGFGCMLLRGHSAHEATFVAAALVATSVAVTARVLKDMNALSSYSARIILGAAVFDDILGMLVLAVVAGLASAENIRWIQLGILSAEAIGFAWFMIFVAPKLIHRIKPTIEGFSSRNAPVFVALGIGLGLSAAAEKIGLAAIIGAFFTGLAFAEYGTAWNLRPRIEGMADFLAPFFFFTIGTQLDLHAFSSPSILTTAIVISGLAILSKLLGCGLPVIGSGRKVALQVGFGMIPRAEVGLIVAALGLQMHLLSNGTYAIVVFMAMATTIITPPLLHLVFEPAPQFSPHAPIHLHKPFLRRFLNAMAGFCICAVVAGIIVFLFQRQSARGFIPIAFLPLIAIVAKFFGRLAGALGTLAIALILAFAMFNPLGSWVVSEAGARTNLGWMILGGIILSYFVGESLHLSDKKFAS